MTVFARAIAFVLVCGLLLMIVPGIGDAQSATTSGSITGTLLDQEGGIPLSKATVTIFQGSTRIKSTATDSRGTYSFTGLNPAIYFATYELTGYGIRRSDDIAVTAGGTVTLQTLIGRSATVQSGRNLRTIGSVTATSRTGNGALATSTTINSNVPSDLLQRQGYTRIGDALQTLPGVNLTGLSSSIGDDLGVDIRGFGNTETESLLDGHPIGPQGVGGNSFGYQLSPSYTIANTQVTYGSGALGLYGTDAIGGTVDMQSIEPTRQSHALFSQGFGYQGRRFTDVQLTGSVLDQKLGYALVHAVDGTYGPYALQARLQPGLLSGDFSPANQAANTYGVSQDYLLRTDLFKLRYNFTPKTSFTGTVFDSSSFDDKSGNGDNCYNTYGLQLYQAQQASQSVPNTYTIGPLPKQSCPAGLVGATFDEVTFKCITPSDYAANSYGFNGGGPGPFQAHRFHDYHGRFQTSLGNNTVTVDGFGNRYTTDYNRAVATGAFNSDFYDTTGLLISDDIASGTNDVGFGYFVQHQNHTGTYVDPSVSPFLSVGVQSTPGLSFATGVRNFFLRDQYTPPGPFSAFFNAWLKRDTLTQKQTLDPRLSFVLRPSARDVFRLTGGRSDGQPAPELVSGPPSYNTTPTNITANCGGLTSVGTTANPGLNSETSFDYEVGYGHRFGGDDVINVNGYYAFEKNRIFGGDLPAAQFSGLLASIPQTLLAEYFTRINSQCSTSNASTGQLSFTTNFNASVARYQGVELNGRYRLSPHLFVDYTGDIQSAVNLGVPDQILSNNVTLINGQQIQGIALQKYAAGLDYSDRGGFETRIDGYYIGAYNGYNRDPFFYANASITKDIGHGVSFNIGVLNLFDSQASILTVKGTAPFQGENRFGTDTSAISQNSSVGNLQTGLLPITAVFSVTARI